MVGVIVDLAAGAQIATAVSMVTVLCKNSKLSLNPPSRPQRINLLHSNQHLKIVVKGCLEDSKKKMELPVVHVKYDQSSEWMN